MLHSAVQLVELVNWSALPASERLQRIGSCVLLMVPCVLAAFMPRFYLR